ncbi:hypothetical protein MMC10_009619 [Thelotrema lepadinum]|nr:hypothetical protein [Thelotrema lepadinum]
MMMRVGQTDTARRGTTTHAMIAETETAIGGAHAPPTIPPELVATKPTLTPPAAMTGPEREKIGTLGEIQGETNVAGKETEATVTVEWGGAILDATTTIAVEGQAGTPTIVVTAVVEAVAEVV